MGTTQRNQKAKKEDGQQDAIRWNKTKLQDPVRGVPGQHQKEECAGPWGARGPQNKARVDVKARVRSGKQES